MAQFVIPDLEGDVLEKLEKLAQSQGQSIEEVVCEILRSAVLSNQAPRVGLGSQFAQRFAGKGLTQDIPEIRRQSIEPQNFDG